MSLCKGATHQLHQLPCVRGQLQTLHEQDFGQQHKDALLCNVHAVSGQAAVGLPQLHRHNLRGEVARGVGAPGS
jgi:hypothetical protein